MFLLARKLSNSFEYGHAGVQLTKFLDLFGGNRMTFGTAATRAAVTDDTHESANRVAVDRVVDGTVADTGLRHVMHDLFEGIQVLRRVAVKFDIADVSAWYGASSEIFLKAEIL